MNNQATTELTADGFRDVSDINIVPACIIQAVVRDHLSRSWPCTKHKIQFLVCVWPIKVTGVNVSRPIRINQIQISRYWENYLQNYTFLLQQCHLWQKKCLYADVLTFERMEERIEWDSTRSFCTQEY